MEYILGSISSYMIVDLLPAGCSRTVWSYARLGAMPSGVALMVIKMVAMLVSIVVVYVVYIDEGSERGTPMAHHNAS